MWKDFILGKCLTLAVRGRNRRFEEIDVFKIIGYDDDDDKY